LGGREYGHFPVIFIGEDYVLMNCYKSFLTNENLIESGKMQINRYKRSTKTLSDGSNNKSYYTYPYKHVIASHHNLQMKESQPQNSQGSGKISHPTKATSEIVWCGLRKGRFVIREVSLAISFVQPLPLKPI